jgi:hypothetical protein
MTNRLINSADCFGSQMDSVMKRIDNMDSNIIKITKSIALIQASIERIQSDMKSSTKPSKVVSNDSIIIKLVNTNDKCPHRNAEQTYFSKYTPDGRAYLQRIIMNLDLRAIHRFSTCEVLEALYKKITIEFAKCTKMLTLTAKNPLELYRELENPSLIPVIDMATIGNPELRQAIVDFAQLGFEATGEM